MVKELQYPQILRKEDGYLYVSVTDQAYQINALELGREVLRNKFLVFKDLPIITFLTQQRQSCGR